MSLRTDSKNDANLLIYKYFTSKSLFLKDQASDVR